MKPGQKRKGFAELQRMDETLQEFWVPAKAEPTEAKNSIIGDEILYRVVKDEDRDEQKWQSGVPSANRTDVLKLAPNSPIGGHMGRQRNIILAECLSGRSKTLPTVS